MVTKWREVGKSGQRGASRFYSDLAIETMACLKRLYGLPGRACEGFLRSVLALMKVDLPVPDHSTFSRRMGHLKVKLDGALPSQPRHLVLDSSGFKVYGEGEWKVKIHGASKRRQWLKNRSGTQHCSRAGDWTQSVDVGEPL